MLPGQPSRRYVLSDAEDKAPPRDIQAFLQRLRRRQVRTHAARLRGAAYSVARFRHRTLAGIACVAGAGVAMSGAWWACPSSQWVPLGQSFEVAAAIGLLVVTPLAVALGGGLAS